MDSLLELTTHRYRSLREQTIRFGDLNVFIGTNASGKSSILDALRLLHEGVRDRDFREAVLARGGIVHLAWKGEEAGQIGLSVRLLDGARTFDWSVRFIRKGFDFSVRETVSEILENQPPSQLLVAEDGSGWWWSGEQKRLPLKQPATACALSAASADATFPARNLVEFVQSWGFFDPAPFSLRRGWSGLDSGKLDSYGRNLAERLFSLRQFSPDRFRKIVSATQSILGLPIDLEPRESEGGFYFAQTEPGLRYPVHQIGTSSGTLRILALMTALHEGDRSTLIGVEEPENHIHPTAIEGFCRHLIEARRHVQILVTTHSPLLLNCLEDPEVVYVVQRDEERGTQVSHEVNPAGVREALEASGFGLGEYHETNGFGG